MPANPAPPARLAMLLAASPPPPATVLKTLDLLNHTLLPGNVVPENASGPLEIAYDGTDGKLFVAAAGGGVEVLNASTNALEAIVPTGGEAFGVAYDAANGEVYVSHYFASNTVTTFLASTDQSTGTVLSVGKEPAGVTVDPATGRVYVVNSGSNDVTVIDGASDTVLGSIPIGRGSHYMVVDPFNDDLFVTNYASDNVSVIDGSTDTVVGSVSVGTAPWGIAYDAANGDVYVVNCGLGCFGPAGATSPGSVTVFNGSTWAVVATITVGPCAGGAAFDAANRDVYVESDNHCFVDGSFVGLISAINGTTDVISATISDRTILWDLAYDPANQLMYLTEPYNDSVTVLNGTLQRIVDVLGDGVMPKAVAFDPANGYAYVANWGENDVAVVDGATGAEIGTIPVGLGPDGLAYDDANGILYVTSSATANVTMIDTRTGQVLGTVAVGWGMGGAAYDPANGDVYVANWNYGLSVIDPASATVVRTISLGSGNRTTTVAYDPANGEIYATGPTANEQYYYDSNISIISSANNSVVGSFIVRDSSQGSGTDSPVGFAYDAVNYDMYVADGWSTEGQLAGSIIAINSSTNQLAAWLNLNGSQWGNPAGIAFDPRTGDLFVSATTRLHGEVFRINGTTSALLSGVTRVGDGPGPLVFDDATGNALLANQVSGTISLFQPTIYPPARYALTFEETGLPKGTAWTVTANGSSNRSTASSIGFSVPDGTYAYSIAKVPGYLVLSSSNGSLAVHGTNITMTVRFAQLSTVTFTESGLPGGVPWSLLWNGSSETASGLSVTLAAVNGSFSFSIPPASGYDPSPDNGTVVVNGSDVAEAIVFELPGPTIVSFRSNPSTAQLGLPIDLEVQVVGGVLPLTFAYDHLPSGCASANLPELACTPIRAGTFSVSVLVYDTLGRYARANASMEVTAAGATLPTGGGGPKFSVPPWLIGGAVAAAAGIGLALALILLVLPAWRRRSRRTDGRGSGSPRALPPAEGAGKGPPPPGS